MHIVVINISIIAILENNDSNNRRSALPHIIICNNNHSQRNGHLSDNLHYYVTLNPGWSIVPSFIDLTATPHEEINFYFISKKRK